jgi:hypothetical protein
MDYGISVKMLNGEKKKMLHNQHSCKKEHRTFKINTSKPGKIGTILNILYFIPFTSSIRILMW